MGIPFEEVGGWLVAPVTIITVGDRKRNGMTPASVSTVDDFRKPPQVTGTGQYF